MLQVDVPRVDSCLENHDKHCLLLQSDLSVQSLLFNFRVNCVEDRVIHVNALDMISVSDYFKCWILRYNKKELTLSYPADLLTRLLALLYIGFAEYREVDDLISLYQLCDFLCMTTCTRALVQSLTRYIDGCTFVELLKIHDFGARFCLGKLSKKATEALLEYPFEEVHEDIAEHCDDLLETIVSSDNLRVASELILYRLLVERSPSLLQHVRVEHMHPSELAVVLAAHTQYQGTRFSEEVHRSSSLCMQGGGRETTDRRPRFVRYVWHMALSPQWANFPGDLKMCMITENATHYILTNKTADLDVYYTLSFCKVELSQPEWDQDKSCYRHSLQTHIELHNHQSPLLFINLRS